MPFLITPPQPLTTATGLPAASLYAIIDAAEYTRRGESPKVITASIGYYASAEAALSRTPLQVPGLLTTLVQAASPEEANTLPLFDFLEALLKTKLEPLLPVGTTFVKVA